MIKEDLPLTDNGKKVLLFMQTHDKIWVGLDLNEEMGIKGIYSTLEGLIRRSLVVKSEPVVREFTNNKGVTQERPYITYCLTDEGRAYQI